MRDQEPSMKKALFPSRPGAGGLSRRDFLGATGALTVGAAIAGEGTPAAAGEQRGGQDVEVTNLGPGNKDYPLLGVTVLNGVMYLGSRNLSPTRVAGFSFESLSVEQSFTLGNGNYAQSLANDGREIVYAGVNQAQPNTNVYACHTGTGEVTELARVPDQSVAALAVAPDGIVYTTGRPENGNRPGPALFSYDPQAGELIQVGVPSPEAGQAIALAATEETVYFGCGSSSAVRGPVGLFAVDRVTGETTDILPPEMSNLRQINAIEVFDDILVAGGGTLGVCDLSTRQWRFTEAIGGRQNVFVRQGGNLFAAATNGLFRIDLDTWDLVSLGDPGGGFGNYQGMTLAEGLLVGATSGGYMWTYDLDSGTSELYDLPSAGAPAGPQAGQSVGVVEQTVYVGGNNSVDVHDLASDEVTKLAMPGEAKAMTPHNGVMYMAAYAPAALWSHTPGEDSARRILGFPPDQNRPRSAVWDEANGLVAIGTRSDSTGGGSLCLYDPETEEFTAHIDPLGESQWVVALAAAHGLIYLAGSNAGGASGDIAAWDPGAGEEVWRMSTPLGVDGGIRAIAVWGRRLFGLTTRGPRFFVVRLNPNSGPKLIHEADYSEYASEGIPELPTPDMLIDRHLVYGMTNHSLFRVDPVRYQPRVIVDGLDSDFFGAPDLAVDEDHNLYTLAGRDLIQIRDRTPPRA